MKAILFDRPGGPEVLYLGQAQNPVCQDDEVLIAVQATAVNRADVMQRQGLYPPPPGASSILGLEAVGHIIAIGANAARKAAHLHLGQQVMALLAGGGYAEEVAVPAEQVMPVPKGLSIAQAAAIPEGFLTAYLNLFVLGNLPWAASAGQQAAVLIHGGASGVGTSALALCQAASVTAYCTVGDDDRAAACCKLGASAAWNYKSTDWLAALHSQTAGRGVDVVLDCVGGSYLDRNLQALAPDGRLICIGLMHGRQAELNLGLLLQRRIQIIGSTLRPLPLDRKAALCQSFTNHVLPLFERGQLRPVLAHQFPLAEAAAAHRALDTPHLGKIVLMLAEPN